MLAELMLAAWIWLNMALRACMRQVSIILGLSWEADPDHTALNPYKKAWGMGMSFQSLGKAFAEAELRDGSFSGAELLCYGKA